MGLSIKTFRALYIYEWKKIGKHRSVWITLALALALILFLLSAEFVGTVDMGDTRIDNASYTRTDIAYQRALNGRAIDTALLAEMKAAYEQIPEGEEYYIRTEEYQTCARPYASIAVFVRGAASMTISQILQWEADEQDLYARRRVLLEEIWDANYLSPGEKDYWREQEAKLEWPLVFRYADGYSRLRRCLYTTVLIGILAIAVCLSGMFAEEHGRRTDQLILSSRYGRRAAYWAKLLAGVSFATVLALLYTLVSFLAAFALYGADGFTAAFQLIDPESSYLLTAGEAVLLSYGMMVLAFVVTAVFVMLLSELLRSSIGALSMVAGMVILLLFVDVPAKYRVLAQLVSFLPSKFMDSYHLFGSWTVPLFGAYLKPWQAAIAVYVFFGVIFAFIGKRVFAGYQVSGR